MIYECSCECVMMNMCWWEMNVMMLPKYLANSNNNNIEMSYSPCLYLGKNKWKRIYNEYIYDILLIMLSIAMGKCKTVCNVTFSIVATHETILCI